MKKIWVFLSVFMLCLALFGGCNAVEEAAPLSDEEVQTFDKAINMSSNIAELIDLGFVSEDEMQDEYITAMEGIRILFRILNAASEKYGIYDIKYWYMRPETERLDYLDGWDKHVLLNMSFESVVLQKEFELMDFDANLTEYEALVFITRLLGNTYGCVQWKEESEFTEKAQTYDMAVQKALIEDASLDHADEWISREAYYELIHKALYAELTRGSIGGNRDFRYIDLLANGKKYDISKEVFVESNAAPVATMTNIDKVLQSNVMMILRDEYAGINESNVNVVIRGEEIVPGTYTRFKKQWVPESISLAEGESFKENVYYLITSYQHDYRKEEYNSVNCVIFKAYETANTLYELYEANENGRPRFMSGGVHLDEIRIQAVMIEGDESNGFTLYITPESSEMFTVAEGSEREY